MKNSLKYYLQIVLLVALLLACQDELVKAPLDAPSNTTFYSNEQDLVLAINGAYTGLWWHGSYRVPVPLHLDNATDLGFLRLGYSDIKTLSRGAGTSESAIFESTWNHFYTAIARVNSLLDNMHRAEDVVSEEFFRRIKAEARFLRAFYYHWLIELYGDVPLLTDVPSATEAEIGRTPKNEVVDLIFEDLNFAAEILPESWSGSDEGRATRGASLALKARVALYNERFDVASEAAHQVMESGEYSLYPDYEAQFKYEGQRSSGVILDAPYQEGIRTTVLFQHPTLRYFSGWSTIVPSQFLVDSYEAVDGNPIDQSPLYDPSQPFENRDPRLDATILRPQGVFGGIVFETHPDSTETWRIVGEDSTRIENQEVTNPFATYTGYIWKKYMDIQDFPENQTSSTVNWIHIRYAEVLLTYAEAKIESNDIDQSVLNVINRVRARAYGVDFSQTGQYPAIMTTSQEELRTIIRRERKVELAYEGFRWIDIRRWGIADEVMNGPLIGRPRGAYSEIPNPPEIDDQTGHPNYGAIQDLYRNVESREFNPKDWLWAIPQAEINVNDNMTQNPGY